MKLNIKPEKLFQDGPKNPLMLAGVVILYGVAMAVAVASSIKDSTGDTGTSGK